MLNKTWPQFVSKLLNISKTPTPTYKISILAYIVEVKDFKKVLKSHTS